MSLPPDRDLEPARAVLLAVHLHDVDDVAFASSLAELHRLARTLGLTVAATITQRRRAFHAGTVVGSGKLKELRALTGAPEPAEEGGAADDEADVTDETASEIGRAHV